MFCMNCGTKLQDGAKFCMSCGCKLGVLAETPATEENVVQAQVVQPKPESCSPYFEKQQQDVKVGDILKLGEWHLDPIEWQVLAVKDGKALLLSKYGLICKKYHSGGLITWENCDLRKWLNGEFFQKVFKGEAAKCVVESHVPAHDNPDYSTDPGNDTKDKVFLLSVEEVGQYFKKDEERICLPLSFVAKEGAYIDENGASYWWLRSPGAAANCDVFIDLDGSAYTHGEFADNDEFVVRPALWVDLSKMN